MKSYTQKFWIGFTLLQCLAFYLQYVGAMWGDKPFMLGYSAMWVSGKVMYHDLFEVQPPFTLFVFALPEYAAHYLGFGVLKDYHFLLSFTYVLIGVVTFLHYTVLKASAHKTQAGILSAFIVLVLTLFTMPNYFGDREHLFLTLVLPYLLLFLPSVKRDEISLKYRSVIGLLAGLGLCMKPHCLVVLGGIILATLLIKKRLSIIFYLENCLIYMVLVVYLASIIYFMPEFFSLVMPMAVATYDVNNQRKQGILYGAGAAITFAVTFIDFRLRYTSPIRKDIFYLVACCFFFLLYALFNNGWGYTWNPLFSIIFITTGFVIAEFITLKKHYEHQQLPFRSFIMGYRAGILNLSVNALIGLFISFYVIFNSCGSSFECEAGKDFIQDMVTINHSRQPKNFGTITMGFTEWCEYSNATGAHWDTRFHSIFMLPKFFISDADFRQKNQWILDYVSNAYAEDLERNRPEIVFVDNADEFYSVHQYVDLIAFLSQLPRFKEAWKNYAYVTRSGIDSSYKTKPHSGYYVYKRITP